MVYPQAASAMIAADLYAHFATRTWTAAVSGARGPDRHLILETFPSKLPPSLLSRSAMDTLALIPGAGNRKPQEPPKEEAVGKQTQVCIECGWFDNWKNMEVKYITKFRGDDWQGAQKRAGTYGEHSRLRVRPPDG